MPGLKQDTGLKGAQVPSMTAAQIAAQRAVQTVQALNLPKTATDAELRLLIGLALSLLGLALAAAVRRHMQEASR